MLLAHHDTTPRSTGDRPADEIEVTDEMIEAGALALASFTREAEKLEEGAERIFRAMIAMRLVSSL